MEQKHLAVPADRSIAIGQMGMEVATLDAARCVAELLVDGGYAPMPKRIDGEAIDAYRARAVAQATCAILKGAEVGLRPLMSVQKIAVIYGQPTIWGDAVPALIDASGACKKREDWYEDSDGNRLETQNQMVAAMKDKSLTAVCKLTKKDGQEVVGKYSMWQADHEGLLNNSSRPAWQRNPEVMLLRRVTRTTCSRAFPAVLGGLLSAEEALDAEATQPRDLAKDEYSVDAPRKGSERDGHNFTEDLTQAFEEITREVETGAETSQPKPRQKGKRVPENAPQEEELSKMDPPAPPDPPRDEVKPKPRTEKDREKMEPPFPMELEKPVWKIEDEVMWLRDELELEPIADFSKLKNADLLNMRDNLRKEHREKFPERSEAK